MILFFKTVHFFKLAKFKVYFKLKIQFFEIVHFINNHFLYKKAKFNFINKNI
jgi:hypothetical protein